jgi:16S rRNA (guanine527-N7)-methyltransferase
MPRRILPVDLSSLQALLVSRLDLLNWPGDRASIVDALSAYAVMICHWNAALSLIAFDSIEELVDRHLLESLEAVEWLPPAASRIGDLGSGAGLPGIPVILARPRNHLVMIERNKKRAAFLRQVAHELRLANVEVVNQDWEEWTTGGQQLLDVVLSRAAARPLEIANAIPRLLRPGGSALLFVGAAGAEALLASDGTACPSRSKRLRGSSGRYLVELRRH